MTNSGFVGGVDVLLDVEVNYKSINKIGKSDSVLSRPETGAETVSYQPVLQTLIHPNREIWLLKAEKTTEMFDKKGNMIDYQLEQSASRNIEFLVTPNHLIWVVGCYEHPDADIEFYEQPQWKRIDELQRYEVVINMDGVMYMIKRVQPVYQYLGKGESQPNPNLYWYQENYHQDYGDDYVQDDTDFEGLMDEEEFSQVGSVYDVSKYEIDGIGKISVNRNCLNYLTNEKGQYIPFTRTVYNLEVANNHTYYAGVGTGFLWVKN